MVCFEILLSRRPSCRDWQAAPQEEQQEQQEEVQQQHQKKLRDGEHKWDSDSKPTD